MTTLCGLLSLGRKTSIFVLFEERNALGNYVVDEIFECVFCRLCVEEQFDKLT